MIKNYADWLNESSQINLGPFKNRFRSYYGHIHHNMSDDEIQAFIAQPHVAKMPLNKQVDLFADYLVSQGLADVVAEKVTPAKASEVDPKELEVGKEVEMEHTTDEKEAERIALQHLAENPHYYKELRIAGLIDEPEALQKAKELDEMAESDVHFKAIVSLWNKSDAQGRRRILDAVGHGTHDFNSLKKELRDMGYEDILDVEKALGLEEPIDEVNEKHWDDTEPSPKVKVGDTYDSYVTAKQNRSKVVYVSKATGAFVVQKISYLGAVTNEFYIYRKEGKDKFGSAADMTNNLDVAKSKADNLK